MKDFEKGQIPGTLIYTGSRETKQDKHAYEDAMCRYYTGLPCRWLNAIAGGVVGAIVGIVVLVIKSR